MNITFKHFYIIFLAGLAFFPLATYGVVRSSVVVELKVGDKVITNYDLRKRYSLFSLVSGTPDTDQSYKKLKKQIQSIVIREALQASVIKQIGLKIGDNEVENYISELARKNSFNASKLYKEGERRLISKASIKDHFRLTLSWYQYILYNYRKQLMPDKEEIEARQNDLLSQTRNKRYVYREILLVNDLVSAVSAKQKSAKVVQLINQGIKIENLTTAFSSSLTANRGGLVGPVSEKELGLNILNALDSLTPGEGIKILKVTRGILIVKLIAIYPPQTIRGTWSYGYNNISPQIGSKLNLNNRIKNFSNCQITEILAKQIPIDIVTKNNVTKATITSSLLEKISGMSVNDIIIIDRQEDDNITLLQLCSKEKIYPGIPNQEKLGKLLLDTRLNKQSQSILNDLQRTTYIDIRGAL